MSPPPPPLKDSKVLHMGTKVQFAEVTLLGTCVLLPEQWLNLACILSKYPLDSSGHPIRNFSGLLGGLPFEKLKTMIRFIVLFEVDFVTNFYSIFKCTILFTFSHFSIIWNLARIPIMWWYIGFPFRMLENGN